MIIWEKRTKKRSIKKIKSTKTKLEHSSEIQAAATQDTISDQTAVEEEEPLEEEAYSDIEDIALEESDIPEEKQTILQKIKRFFIKFVKFFKNIKFTFNKVCDTMVKIKDNIKYYLEVLQLRAQNWHLRHAKNSLVTFCENCLRAISR